MAVAMVVTIAAYVPPFPFVTQIFLYGEEMQLAEEKKGRNGLVWILIRIRHTLTTGILIAETILAAQSNPLPVARGGLFRTNQHAAPTLVLTLHAAN